MSKISKIKNSTNMKKIHFYIITLIFLNTITLNAQTWTKLGTEIIGDEELNYFGSSVSLNTDGSVIAIGAPYNSKNGTNAGQVKIFQYNSDIWEQIGDDIYGEYTGDEFGRVVSINSDGSIIAVGSEKNNENGTNTGQVRIFQNISGTWQQIGNNINGKFAGDKFGKSVSINSDGSIVAAGTIFNNENGTKAGQVRIFQNISGTWQQIGNDINGENEYDCLGKSICLNSEGSIIAIGIYGNDENGTNSGQVKIFQNNSGNWQQIGENINGEYVNDSFGDNVSLNSDGTVVAVGVKLNDGNGENAGHIRIFQNISGSWIQIGQDIDGNHAEERFGQSIDLNDAGSVVAVGANGEWGTFDPGLVRIYKNIENTWIQIGEDITAEDGEELFGASVSLNSSGNILAIGAPGYANNVSSNGYVSIWNSNCSNINSLKDVYFSIYPNPTKGNIKINFINKYDEINLNVTNILGQKILQKRFTDSELIEFSINDLNGIYIIELIIDNNQKTTFKVLKN